MGSNPPPGGVGRLGPRHRPEHLDDEEVLACLLMNTEPHDRALVSAKALVERFGGFSNALAADPVRLAKDCGLAAGSVSLLKVVQEAARRVAREEILQRPVLESREQLLCYCRVAMARETVEKFRLLFLDARDNLIADELQQNGTVNHAPIYPREVVKRALELGASAIVMIHNHPSGDPTPSAEDIEITRQVEAAATTVGVSLHDHIVIGRGGHTSFKALGLLRAAPRPPPP